jgi:hypothetical protein
VENNMTTKPAAILTRVENMPPPIHFIKDTKSSSAELNSGWQVAAGIAGLNPENHVRPKNNRSMIVRSTGYI